MRKISIILFIFSVLILSCDSNSSFIGSGAQQKTKPSSNTVDEVILTIDNEKAVNTGQSDSSDSSDTSTDTDDTDSVPMEVAFALTGQKVTPKEDFAERNFWLATMSGHVYYMKLKKPETEDEAPQVETTKHWTFSGAANCGIRTYVTEHGFLFSQCAPIRMYYVSKDTPTETVIDPGWTSSGSTASFRSCVVSYKKGDTRYAGMGWNDAGEQKRKFVEIPISNDAPYNIDFSKATVHTLGDSHAQDHCTGQGGWGYSCHIDQENLIYFGACHNTPSALNLKTMTEIPIADATKNSNFVSTNLGNDFYNVQSLPSEIWNSSIHTYAIGGDGKGNLYMGAGRYAYTYESKSKTVWNSANWTDGKLGVFPSECFDSKGTCENFVRIDPATLGFTPGCLSSLGDGLVISAARMDNKVYALRLQDYKNPLSTVQVFPLTPTVTGGLYMYNDFTGATLYALPVSLKFDLTEKENFKKERETVKLVLNWKNKNGFSSDWPSDVSVKARCYAKDEESLPDEEPVLNINKATTPTEMTILSCKTGYEIVEVNLYQEKGNRTIFGIDSVDVGVTQLK